MKTFKYILIMVLVLLVSGCSQTQENEDVSLIPIDSKEISTQVYSDIESIFKNVGFSNIELVEIEGSSSQGHLDGQIESILVNNQSKFTKGEEHPSETAILIKFYSVEEELLDLGTLENPLTVDNNEDLKFILSKGGTYDSFTKFSKNYYGKIIQFEGRMDYIANHENYDTRFDFLVSAGDYNPDTQQGPTFKFEDIGRHPGIESDSIFVGSNVTIIAKVGGFNDNTGIFLLRPEIIKGR